MELDEKTQKKLDTENNNCEKKIEFLPTTNSFSKLLEGVVLAASNSNVAFQGQFGMSHQEALGTVTAIAAQTLHQRKNEDEPLESSSEPPLTSQSEIFSPKHSSAGENIVKQDSDALGGDVPMTPKSDEFNWRKYGQKPVKSSGSSRSYFRCTNPSCCAKKKVQHFDESGKIIEVVYKGDHNHDPPPCIVKSISRKRSFNDSSVEACKEEPKQVLLLTYESQESHLKNSVGTLKSGLDKQLIKIPDAAARYESEPKLRVEVEHGKSSNSKELALSDTMNERDIPIKKRRIKENLQSVYRTFKEPKIVVHTSGDAGISSDGYRWRKYGQKMVKGNIYPRSYYRCSSTGCPVRKHVERATNGSSAIISMYEGEHDHEKPLPKKQQATFKSSTPLSSPTSTVNKVPLFKSAEEKPAPPGRESSNQLRDGPNNDPGEPMRVSEPGAQKVLEMSVGIELKSC